MQSKKKVWKHNVSRSIEEIVLLRKLELKSRQNTQTNEIDGKNPLSWPNIVPNPIIGSSSMTILDTNQNIDSKQRPMTSMAVVTSGNEITRRSQPMDELKRSLIMNDSKISQNIHHMTTKSTNWNQESVLDAMRDYCKILENKVIDLELKLQTTNDIMTKELNKSNLALQEAQKKWNHSIHSQRKMILSSSSSSFHDSSSSSSSGPGSHSIAVNLVREGYSSHSIQDKSLLLRDDVKQSLGEIDIKILNLKQLFKSGNPFEIRYYAATKIGAIIRGYLARNRYILYKQSIVAYKWNKTKYIIYVLDHYLAKQTKLDIGMKRMQLLRNMKLILAVFNRWSYISKTNTPIRKKIRCDADEMFLYHKRKFLRNAFEAFKCGCIGLQSQRNVREQRLLLVESIRGDLRKKAQANGGIGIILEDEVKQILYRHIVTSFLEKRNMGIEGRIFSAWKDYMTTIKSKLFIAKKHWFKKRVGICFYGWSDYIYLVGQGLQRKRWPGPRRYEVRYNQRRLDHFTRIRLLRYIFLPLKAYIRVELKGKRAYKKYASKVLKSIVLAWRTVSNKDHVIRKQTIQNWLEYPALMTVKPFQAWKQYIIRGKTKEYENNNIANTYLRWKLRQKLYVIMKTWRHQALYGRLDGMYTRQMLVKSLQEQKQHSNAITKLLATQTMELEECRGLVHNETLKKEEIQEKLRLSYLECSRLRSLAHHAQQEQRRLEALVGSMSILNPKQFEHIRRLQPNFTFKERMVKERVFESIDNKAEEEIQRIQELNRVAQASKNNDNDSNSLIENETVGNNTDKMTDSIVSDGLNTIDMKSLELSDEINADLKFLGHTTHPQTSKNITNVLSSEKTVVASDTIESNGGVAEGYTMISYEDSILLDRVKWLLQQFGDRITYPAQLNPTDGGGSVNSNTNRILDSSDPMEDSSNSNNNNGSVMEQKSPNRKSIKSVQKRATSPLKGKSSNLGGTTSASATMSTVKEDTMFPTTHPNASVSIVYPAQPIHPILSILKDTDKATEKNVEKISDVPIPLIKVRIKYEGTRPNRITKHSRGQSHSVSKDKRMDHYNHHDDDSNEDDNSISNAEYETEHEGEEAGVGDERVRYSNDVEATAAAFSSAVTAATTVAIRAIQSNVVTQQGILASDFLGLGSEYVAAKMLIGIMTFLAQGDISIFSVEDKRSWAKQVFHGALLSSEIQNILFPISESLPHQTNTIPSPSVVRNGNGDGKEVGLESEEHHSRNQDQKISDVTIVGNIVKNIIHCSDFGKNLPSSSPLKPNHPKRLNPPPSPPRPSVSPNVSLWNNSMDEATQSILANDFTWRAALVSLRSLHPIPHQFHTIQSIDMKLKQLDPDYVKPHTATSIDIDTSKTDNDDNNNQAGKDTNDSNLPLRLLQMKEQLTRVMQSQEKKAQNRFHRMTDDSNDDNTNIADKNALHEYVKKLMETGRGNLEAVKGMETIAQNQNGRKGINNQSIYAKKNKNKSKSKNNSNNNHGNHKGRIGQDSLYSDSDSDEEDEEDR